MMTQSVCVSNKSTCHTNAQLRAVRQAQVIRADHCPRHPRACDRKSGSKIVSGRAGGVIMRQATIDHGPSLFSVLNIIFTKKYHIISISVFVIDGWGHEVPVSFKNMMMGASTGQYSGCCNKMPLPSADHPRVTCESEPEETPHSSMSGPASPEAIGSPQPPPQAVPTALEILEPIAQMNEPWRN